MADRYTEFGLTYNLTDVRAKKDATIQVIGADEESKVILNPKKLFNNVKFNNLMMRQLSGANLCILDGTFFPISETDFNTNVGLYIEDDRVTITITTTEYHASSGLTFYFKDRVPHSIDITYYKDNVSVGHFTYEAELTEGGYNFSSMYTYQNDCYRFISNDEVQLWNKIEIYIRSDSEIKLQGLLFGTVLDLDELKLKQGTLVQEISRISDMISINTLSFELIDLDNSLNFGNPNGLHKYFQRQQELLPYEVIDNTYIPLGKFYLDTYSNELNLGKFSAVSFMGLMDGIAFNEGEIYNGVRAKIVIDKIFAVCDFEDYEIDSETANQLLYGTIAPCTAREALKQVLFACNSILDSTDSQQSIKICKSSVSQLYSISRNSKISTKVTRNAYVSGVEVDYQEYKLGQDTAELHKATYEPGTYTVILTSPCVANTVTISGATKIKASTYYVEFTVATTREVTISGKQYELKVNKVVTNRPYIAPGEIENVKKYSSSLCNATTAKALSKKLLEYHTSQTLTLEIKHIANDTGMNDLRIIQNENPDYDNYLGVFASRTFDLTGGFTDTAKLQAYFNDQDYNYYTRDASDANAEVELYGPEHEEDFTPIL